MSSGAVLALLVLAASEPPANAPPAVPAARPSPALPTYAIEPGHERLFQAVLPAREGELPEGFGLRGLSVPKDRVEALYGPPGAKPASCAEAPLCVVLLHPSAAAAGDRVAGPYAIHASDPEAARALVAGIAARLEAAKPPDPWKKVKVELAAPEPRPDAERVPSDPALAAGLEGRFRALVAADPELASRLLRVEVSPARVRYVFRAGAGGTPPTRGGDAEPGEAEGEGPPAESAPESSPESSVVLRDRTPRQSDPTEVTRSFFVQGLGVTDPPDLAKRVHAAVLAADDGSLRLEPQDVMATGERPWLHLVLVALSALFLLALVLALPFLFRAAAGVLGRDPVVWSLLGAGAALRLALPYRMVEMGIGYQLVRLADELTLPRYGAGTTTLHHAVFQVFGADHTTMAWTHKVLGALTLPLACAAGVRLAGDRGRAIAPFWAGALAVTPMLVKSDLTESNLVPVLWALFSALVAWTSTSGTLRIAATAAGLGFAALSRPEMAAVAPALWLALARPWRERTLRRPALAVAVVLAVAIPFQLAFVRHVVGWETAEGSLHLQKGLSPERVLAVLGQNALLDPRLVPAAVPVLALLALGARETRGRVAVWLLGGLAWLYVYSVDLSKASMPRLHLVGLLPWSLAAAAGVAWLRDRSRLLAAGAVLAWLATAAATVPTLWAPTNEDVQDASFDRLRASLPEGPYVLAMLTSTDAPDPPGHFTHRHAPVYRFRDGEVVPLSSIAARLDPEDPAAPPVFFFQGVSCHASLLRADRGERGLLPACDAVRERFDLEPVWEEDVPNHGNPVHQELGYYGDDPSFRIGLYRVRGLRAR